MAGTPLFADDSAIRRVHSEGVILLGGAYAMLMQLAHPAIAAGAVEHSYYRQIDPRSIRGAAGRLRRLGRTLRLLLAIVYGTPEQAGAAAGHINGLHTRVKGEGYSAADPDLLLWVIATLVDSSLRVHAHFLRPLDPGVAEAYYQDLLSFGEALGLERYRAPRDLREFRQYWEGAIACLEITPTSKMLAQELFQAPVCLSPVAATVWQVTGGLLDPRLRERLGLQWGRHRQALWLCSAWLSRMILPRLPHRLRRTPRFLLPPIGSTGRQDRG